MINNSTDLKRSSLESLPILAAQVVTLQITHVIGSSMDFQGHFLPIHSLTFSLFTYALVFIPHEECLLFNGCIVFHCSDTSEFI